MVSARAQGSDLARGAGARRRRLRDQAVRARGAGRDRALRWSRTARRAPLETGRYDGSVTPEQLSQIIADALAALVDRGAITLPDGAPSEVRVERPKNKEHGDYATNIALQLAKKAGMPPREFAELLATELQGLGRDRRRRHRRAGLHQHHGRGRRPGRGRAQRSSRPGRRTARPTQYAGQKINLEFVSANPTGPIHIGGARWAPVGDSLARIFAALGADVSAGVLLQRPRRPDRPVRAVASRRGARAGRRPRTGTSARTSPRSRSGSSPSNPDVLSTPRRPRRRRSSGATAST